MHHSEMRVPRDVTSSVLVSFSRRKVGQPHVVVLGAGASLAAFPVGDANGKTLPLMANLTQVLGLGPLLSSAGFDPEANFENLYGMLAKSHGCEALLMDIESRVLEYFSGMELPHTITLYDKLLCSLRPKDAVFTFNWDPFLADAYSRCFGRIPLPKIFHLHGNVRIAYCESCQIAIPNRIIVCQKCGSRAVPSRLLYPVDSKDYSAEGAFIRSQWEQLRWFLRDALLVTIFGYRCPESDKEAMEIFRVAWKVSNPETRPIHRVEIIDTRGRAQLADQWCPFAHFPDHIDFCEHFEESWLGCYPRRSCEALACNGWDGLYVEKLSHSGSFDMGDVSFAELINAESHVK